MNAKRLFLAVMLFVASGVLSGASLPELTGDHPNTLTAKDFLDWKAIRTEENLHRELQELTESTPDDTVGKWLAVSNTYRHLPDKKLWDISYNICIKILNVRTSVPKDSLDRYQACIQLSKISSRKGDRHAAIGFTELAIIEAEKTDRKDYQIIGYLRLGDFYSYIDSKKTIDCYQKALNIAVILRNKYFMAEALIYLGNARAENVTFGERILVTNTDCYQEALNLAEILDDRGLMVQALIGLCNARLEHVTLGEGTLNRIQCYQKALNIAVILRNKDFMAQALIGLGNAMANDTVFNGRMLTTQIDHYQEALNLAERLDDRGLMVQALIGLGNTMANNTVFNGRMLTTQIDHYQEALKIAVILQDVRLMAEALIGLGNARAERVTLGKSILNRIQCYQEALNLAERLDDRGLMVQALIGLGNARAENVTFGERILVTNIDCYKKALNLAVILQNKGLMAQALIGLGNARANDVVISDRTLRTDRDCYQEALNIAHYLHDNELMAQALIGLGHARAAHVTLNGRFLETNINCYQEALRIAPNNNLKIKAYEGLARAYTSWRNKPGYAEAIVCYDAILFLDPSNREAMRSLQTVDRYMKELDKPIGPPAKYPKR